MICEKNYLFVKSHFPIKFIVYILHQFSLSLICIVACDELCSSQKFEVDLRNGTRDFSLWFQIMRAMLLEQRGTIALDSS